jgi:hypothetical protein
MPRRLLVSRVDHANALVDAAVVNRLNVAAAQREHVRDAVAPQSLSNQAPTMSLCHFANYIAHAGLNRDLAKFRLNTNFQPSP